MLLRNLRIPENQQEDEIQQLHQQLQRPQKSVKRKIAISRFIDSVYIGKHKGGVVKGKNERPSDPEERKAFKYTIPYILLHEIQLYLCPICFRYFNEILECNFCENYLCMYCARDLIKFELRRTKQLDPVPPEDEIQISCPHCLELSDPSTAEGYLFRDVDKNKPLKIYTDSPTGTLMIGAFPVTVGGGDGEDEMDEQAQQVKVSIAKQIHNFNSFKYFASMHKGICILYLHLRLLDAVFSVKKIHYKALLLSLSKCIEFRGALVLLYLRCLRQQITCENVILIRPRGPFSIQQFIAKIRSDDLPEKVGLRIEYQNSQDQPPPPRSKPPKAVSNRRQSINGAATGASLGKNFIQRAHLEVLKKEAIEDQFLAKKMADIICSPRRLRQMDHSFNMNNRDSFVNSMQKKKSTNSLGGAQQYVPPPPQIMRNSLMKEHFWSNDFIRQLQQTKLKAEAGSHRTFEDLAIARPVSIFEENDQDADSDQRERIDKMNKSILQKAKLNSSIHHPAASKPPLPFMRSHQKPMRQPIKAQNNNNISQILSEENHININEESKQQPIPLLSDEGTEVLHFGEQGNIKLENHSARKSIEGFSQGSTIPGKQKNMSLKFAFFKGPSPKNQSSRLPLASQLSIAKANTGRKTIGMPSQHEPLNNQGDFNFVQIKDDFMIFDQHTNTLQQSDRQTTLGHHFVQQNPFLIFTDGMLKISEILQQQKQSKLDALIEEIKEDEQVQFSDSSFLELSMNKGINNVELEMISPTVHIKEEPDEDDDDLERDIINGLAGQADREQEGLRIK